LQGVAILVRSFEVEVQESPREAAAQELPADRVVLASRVERLVHVRRQADPEHAALLRPCGGRTLTGVPRGAGARGSQERDDGSERRHLHRSNHSRTSSLVVRRSPARTAVPLVLEYVYRIVLGSSASRSPSPTRLNASVVRKRKSPGNTIIHQATVKMEPASESILPHEGVVAGTPIPRNESAASNRML